MYGLKLLLFGKFCSLKIITYFLSKDTEIPQTRISQIIRGNRSITADTALRLAEYFGVDPKFWLGLQSDYDLENEREKKREVLLRIGNIRTIVISLHDSLLLNFE